MPVNVDSLVQMVKNHDSFTDDEKSFIVASINVAAQVVGRGPFICGKAGKDDENGLPEKFFICPEFGCDGFAVYKQESGYDAPGW